jgi:hypothetical protein
MESPDDREASQTEANPAGLTIRLLGLARRNSNSKTVKFSIMRSGLVIRDKADDAVLLDKPMQN